jgi:hypothetical protein
MQVNVQSAQRSWHLSEQAMFTPLGENRAWRVARSLGLSPLSRSKIGFGR